MRDLVNNVGMVQALGPALLSADSTSSAIDLTGFDSAVIGISVGAGGITFDATNKVEFKVTHGETAGGTFTAVEQSDIVGASVSAGGIVKSLTAAHAVADVSKIGYVGDKAFVKVQADFSGTHGTGTPVSVTVTKSHPRNAPVA